MTSLHLFLVLSIFSLAFTANQKRTVIITGANRGIGLAATRQLAISGKWNIVMACRNKELAEAARSTINGKENCQVVELDLANLDSVKKFVKNFDGELHCLACNAGIQLSAGTGNAKGTAQYTVNGFERTIGTNHIGHMALLQGLLPYLQKTPESRIVIVGSSLINI